MCLIMSCNAGRHSLTDTPADSLRRDESSTLYSGRVAGDGKWLLSTPSIGIVFLIIPAGIIKKTIPIEGVLSSHFPSPATRPEYSVLDSSLLKESAGVSVREWRPALQDMIRHMATHTHSN